SMIQYFSSGRPWEERMKHSRAILVGPLFRTCLTSPSDSSGAILFPGDVRGQTRQCLKIIGETLAQADMGFEHIVSTNIYMLDTKDWEEAGEAHAEIVLGTRPTLSFIGCSNFWHPDILLEVEVHAFDPRRTFAPGPSA